MMWYKMLDVIDLEVQHFHALINIGYSYSNISIIYKHKNFVIFGDTNLKFLRLCLSYIDDAHESWEFRLIPFELNVYRSNYLK